MWKALKWWWLVYINYHISEFWASECRESLCSCGNVQARQDDMHLRSRCFVNYRGWWWRCDHVALGRRLGVVVMWAGSQDCFSQQKAREAKDHRLCRQQEVRNAREGRRLSWSKMRQKQHKFPEQGFSLRWVMAGKGCTDAGARVVSKRGCLAY